MTLFKQIQIILNKYNFKDDLVEYHFKNKEELYGHYQKHVISDEDGPLKMSYLEPEDYDELAHILSMSKAGNINERDKYDVIGYTTNSGRFVKFNPKSGLCVIYADDSFGANVISLYRTTVARFFSKVNGSNPNFSFKSHLPEEQKNPINIF